MTSFARACAAASLLSLLGCHREVFVPPARPMPLESAAALADGETGIGGEFGRHAEVFGVDAYSGSARVRRGVGDGTDVSIEGAVVHVSGHSAAGTMQEIYSARFGAKREMVKNRWLSLSGGVGGGYGAGGGFVSPDFGPIFAYENPYFVPFVTIRGGLSLPIGAQNVDISNDSLERHVFKPVLTWNFGSTVGFRIPIGPTEPRTGAVRASLLAGFGVLHLAHVRDDATVMQGSGGAEIAF